ncbi:MAG: hypothetical protein IPP45_10515 [Sphingomonadales bacterium]|nr:hypothetical protein [Sphingomonadales bacterium]
MMGLKECVVGLEQETPGVGRQARDSRRQLLRVLAVVVFALSQPQRNRRGTH